ncbi:selenocysteine insertion sequence-binding protein 2 isoform X6 [Trichechus manatus latirostris]|uniref:Selenocysteine insertion sequence-binding protein 2 isoform X6 n=1 Tax=Trichechus manatus latirostris TaxID=127582 RepID=A0A2Y9RLC4_TRIMA|nr:selenocysteine insertion sequence-binding protein 2 isoform X6 [Trichechus manatus latirostris]
MTSERPREPGGEGIKLSADVKPFVPRFAGLNVAWSESSEARVFPGCAATYYPFVQELPVTEQKTNAEDTAFGASTFPPQYLSSDVTIHPFTYSPYTFESTQNVCSVPGSQYEYSQPGCYEGFQTVTPQSERMCPLPQEAKGLLKSKVLQGGNPEQNEVSRKNKKKKEKSKPKYEVLTVQEPPRIEDAEEFPNLAVASERRNRVESTKFQSKQQQQNNFKSSRKKSEIPVQLDLGGMLTALEKKQHSQNAKQSSKPVVVSVGAVPVLSREATSGMKNHHLNQVLTPHNPLDSSAPLRKKGKQREVPKAKKPTSLKKIILKERQERKQQRLQENIASDAVQDVESSGDDQSLPQADPSAPGETEESVPSTLVEESGSEEPLRAEPQSDIEACHLGLDSASFPKIHSRRFRDYCSQMLSKEVDACVTDLLKELVRFQDRMYQKDPVKAKTKRRLVLGLREVLKHLKLRKLKCVIISPNCEKIQSKGGLDDTLHTIIDYACEQNIPFVFALNRKALGRSLNKAVPVSVVGIFSYDGAQDQFHKMVELTMAARQEYKTMLESVRRELAEEPGARSPPSPPPQGPSCSAEDAHPASTEKEEPHYIEIWRKHLEAYNRCAQELEETLGASTSQMMNLKL